MKYKLLLPFFFLCSAYISLAQAKNFSLTRPAINEIVSIEKSNGGKLFETSIHFSVSKDYFPNADKFQLGNPFIYFREGRLFNLELNYYYSLPDSIIRLVSYSWNGSKETSDELTNIFNENAKIFSALFGLAGLENNEKHDGWDGRNIIWENDTVYVKQFQVISQSTNRVRVLLSWK